MNTSTNLYEMLETCSSILLAVFENCGSATKSAPSKPNAILQFYRYSWLYTCTLCYSDAENVE